MPIGPSRAAHIWRIVISSHLWSSSPIHNCGRGAPAASAPLYALDPALDAALDAALKPVLCADACADACTDAFMFCMFCMFWLVALFCMVALFGMFALLCMLALLWLPALLAPSRTWLSALAFECLL